jgi:hypothetical protein
VREPPPSTPYVTPSQTDRINKLYAAPLDMCVSLLGDLHTRGTHATRGGRKNLTEITQTTAVPPLGTERKLYIYTIYIIKKYGYAKKIIS